MGKSDWFPVYFPLSQPVDHVGSVFKTFQKDFIPSKLSPGAPVGPPQGPRACEGFFCISSASLNLHGEFTVGKMAR